MLVSILYSSKMIYEPDDILAIEPPSPTLARLVTAPLRFYFNPVMRGLEHVNPNLPALYVGNHTLYGGIDWPLLVEQLYTREGIFLRSLADRAHFKVPGWRLHVHKLGVVHGTPENCRLLMQHRKHVLVYPGGSREICKRRGEEYTLTWKKRVGFLRMAIENQYPIIPVASVGPDEIYNIWIDANDVMQSIPGKLMKMTGVMRKFFRDGDVIPPVGRGLGPTLLPRPERFYFGFGAPISTKRFKGKIPSEAVLFRLRDQVAEALYGVIDSLQEYREEDNEVGPIRRLLTNM